MAWTKAAHTKRGADKMRSMNGRNRVAIGVVLGLIMVLSLLAGGLVSHATPLERNAVSPGGSAGQALQLSVGNPGRDQPEVADAFAFLSPCNITVTQGTTFTLDLIINGGSNVIAGQ